MPIYNTEIAAAFYKLADLLEAQGANPYKIRAYRRAASVINRIDKELEMLNNQGADLTELPWIEKLIIESLKHPKHNEKFIRLFHAMPVIESFLFHLKSINYVKTVLCTGDYRRRKEVVGNVVILLVTSRPELVFKQLILFPEIRAIIKLEKNNVQFYLQNSMQVSVLRVAKVSLAAAELYFTGSELHLNHLIKIAHQKKMELNESGLFREKKRIPTPSEADIYQCLKLQFIAPELREDRGEIERAKINQLPKLIKLENIKGDLHCHTHETDGREPLEMMVKAAIERGYEYVAITDHSQSLRITNGMDAKRLLNQIKLIDRLNEKYEGVITILKSMEVDILEDGSLDLPNTILKELDLCVCSIHSKFRIPQEKQTERIIRAMDNPYFTILGHATGRLINSRKPYELAIEKIIQAAKDRGCFLELNAQPYRLDIHDVYCKMAKEAGVKISISSDAHSTYEMDYMRYGIYQARRGWLETEDVINTRSLNAFKKIIQRK